MGVASNSPRLATAWAAWAAVAALVVATYLAVEPTLATAEHQVASDEGFYARFTARVASEGLGAFPALTEEWLAQERSWIFPPPTRVGYVVAGSLWSKVAGHSFQGLSLLSLWSLLALVAVQFAFARRHFGELPGVLIAALSAMSPLLLGMSRLALTENFITLCQVAALWLFLEVVRRPESWSWRIAFVAAFAFSILSKEIAALLALPMAAYVAIERFARKRRLSLLGFSALLAAPVVLSVGVWTLSSGGVTPLIRVMKIVLGAPATNPYAQQYGSGPWTRYPVDQLLMSPWTTALGLAALAIVLWRWRQGQFDAPLVFFAIAYVLLVAVLGLFTKNLRYAAVLEAPLRASAVLLAWQLFDLRSTVGGRIGTCLLVACLCYQDWHNFRRVFLEARVFDPVNRVLLEVRGMLPPSK